MIFDIFIISLLSIKLLFKVVNEKNCLGTKTVPRNPTNKNMQHKNNNFMLFFTIKSIENTTKTLFKFLWGFPKNWEALFLSRNSKIVSGTED